MKKVHDTIAEVDAVRFTLNGEAVDAIARGADVTLLDALRERGLTGAKEGCAEGECGACTVVIVSSAGGQAVYRTLNSCLILLPMAAGHEVYTVESLSSGGALAPAQEAMAAGGGSQCGYCTPGFVMSLMAEQYRPARTTACDTLALAGNLCRCTGYRPIRDAAATLGAPPRGVFLDRLGHAPPVLESIVSDTFARPTTLDACLRMLSERPDARIVAGATDVAVESNLHGKRFRHLVSVEAVAEMREFTRDASALRLGAALTLSDIGERWLDAPMAIGEWLALFASPPIRNRATLGGNLATASPIGDAAPLLLALDARVTIAASTGTRSVPLTTFFLGYRQTVLRPGELLTTVEIPLPVPAALRFYKIAKRRLDDISTVAAAMALSRDGLGRVVQARFCFGGVAATPVRLTAAEDAIVGLPWDERAVRVVQAEIDASVTPLSDHRGSRAYRLEVSKSLVEKFYWESLK